MIISISFLSLIITNYLVVNKLRTYKKELIEEKGKLYATSELEHTYWVNFLQGIHTDGTKFDNVKLASKEQPPIALEEYMKDIPYVLLVRITPNKAVHHLTDSYLKNISQRYFQTN